MDNLEGYLEVTESPGMGALPETLDMLRTRYEIAAELAEGGELLEVGCGPGIGLGFIARRAKRVVGGDIDTEMVRAVNDHYQGRLEVRWMNAGEFPFEDSSFDVVALLEAIYYFPDPARFVSEAKRVLRPGGVLFICSANPERPYFNPSPCSCKYFSAKGLKELMEPVGFSVRLLAGFPTAGRGIKSSIFGLMRVVAVRFGLIPKTMAGKELVKRLLYGRLEPFPAELTEDVGTKAPLVEISGDSPVTGFKVIYAIGRLGQ